MDLADRRTPDGVEAITIHRDSCLIFLERRGLQPAAEVVGRAFTSMAQTNVPILMFSQASSAGNFGLVVPHHAAEAALKALDAEFQTELAQREVSQLKAQRDILILTITTRNPATTMLLYDALAAHEINILLLAQSASGRSGSVAICLTDEHRALAALRQCDLHHSIVN